MLHFNFSITEENEFATAKSQLLPKAEANEKQVYRKLRHGERRYRLRSSDVIRVDNLNIGVH
jgi:hypothetical protein